ncbi:hypothetical protein ACMGT0_23270 [Pseudomonas sp. RHF3.3-3]|uniref:hypothetical protein n=1 Tax=Pseudomonas sp. RHF3.3-3 TaxID=3396624 RepID=UPI003A894227
MSTKITPPVPLVPLLSRDNALDLDSLGSDDLMTYIQYPGIAKGHLIAPQWRGRARDGQAIDETANQDVDDRLEYDDNGDPWMPIPIVNSKVVALDQGEVFYSYRYSEDGGNTFTDESLRLFFYVGKRPWMSSLLLPVAHLKESHDRCVDVNSDPVLDGATLTTVPYQAMAEGDELAFVWAGYRPGSPTPIVETYYKTVSAEEVGHPLEWHLPYARLQIIKNGYALMSYSVTYADPVDPAAPQTYSAEQRIAGVPPSEPLLPLLSVVGHAGGQIDPSLYPFGVPLRIPPYADPQVGDTVVVYADGENSSIQLSMQLDITNVESAILELRLDARWLQAHYGEEVSLSYQYARAGASLSSEALVLRVRRQLRLLAPVVENAVPYDDDGTGIPKGWITAPGAQLGVVIRIPEEGEVVPADERWVVWSGHDGDHRVDNPVGGSDWRYKIVSEVIPADLGKWVKIRYAVIPVGERDTHWSPDFELYIKDFEGGWPSLQAESPKVSDGLNGIRLSQVGQFMVFKVSYWQFMDEGQLLKAHISGIRDSDGETVSRTMRDESEPVTEDEFYDGQVLVKVSGDFIQQLRIGEQFDVTFEVSFDKGNSYKSFGVKAFKLLE